MINLLNEKPLHAALKAWYTQPHDVIEASVDGYLVDIVRDDLLIEIQTRNFSAIKRKLSRLLERHPLRLVYPIAREKWILRLAKDGVTPLGRRRSPKSGKLHGLFHELVHIPHLVAHPNFSIEVLFIQEEEVRFQDGRRAWRRRGWVTKERRLLGVIDRASLDSADSMAMLLPPTLPTPFSTADIARDLHITLHLAQRMAYCLKAMGVIAAAGKKRNSILYSRVKRSA